MSMFCEFPNAILEIISREKLKIEDNIDEYEELR